jgi:hypothetical protein
VTRETSSSGEDDESPRPWRRARKARSLYFREPENQADQTDNGKLLPRCDAIISIADLLH